MKKSTLLHLRLPFSFFLLPVFLFGAAVSAGFSWQHFALAFFILHFLLYPASNAYNSFFDKDEQSIGGLKHPPAVSRELHAVAWILDVVGLLLGLFISWQFVLMLLIYGLVSKAYSHPAIRLKKMPVAGWLAAGFFQGYFTFLMVVLGLQDLTFPDLIHLKYQLAGGLCTLLLFGSYPMTQVYQHDEDNRRGDMTMSIVLGIKGTFHFTAIFFMVSVSLFFWFFTWYYEYSIGWIFLGCLLPVLIYFTVWYIEVKKNPENADFDRTMRLNFLSGVCLNVFFLWLLVS